jgi:heme exporter protein D
MTHLPYIAGSYGLTLALVLWLAIGARQRCANARRKLNELDPRGRV